MAVSSLNSDYGKTWGVLTSTIQKPSDKPSDSSFKSVLSKVVADEPEPVKTYAANETTKADEAPITTGETPDTDTAYRHSLLDPNKLPEGLEWGDGSCSMDVVARPEYRVTDAGNIERVDFLTGGREHFTFIPNTEGGWKLSPVGGVDSATGTVYSRQDSAYKISVAYARGVGSEEYYPTGYVEGQFEKSLESMLEKTKKTFTHIWA